MQERPQCVPRGMLLGREGENSSVDRPRQSGSGEGRVVCTLRRGVQGGLPGCSVEGRGRELRYARWEHKVSSGLERLWKSGQPRNMQVLERRGRLPRSFLVFGGESPTQFEVWQHDLPASTPIPASERDSPNIQAPPGNTLTYQMPDRCTYSDWGEKFQKRDSDCDRLAPKEQTGSAVAGFHVTSKRPDVSIHRNTLS